MPLVISDDIMKAAHITADEMKQDIAASLYQKERISLAKAAKFAGMDRVKFQHLLASKNIPINFAVKDYKNDLGNLGKLGLL